MHGMRAGRVILAPRGAPPPALRPLRSAPCSALVREAVEDGLIRLLLARAHRRLGVLGGVGSALLERGLPRGDLLPDRRLVEARVTALLHRVELAVLNQRDRR